MNDGRGGSFITVVSTAEGQLESAAEIIELAREKEKWKPVLLACATVLAAAALEAGINLRLELGQRGVGRAGTEIPGEEACKKLLSKASSFRDRYQGLPKLL